MEVPAEIGSVWKEAKDNPAAPTPRPAPALQGTGHLFVCAADGDMAWAPTSTELELPRLPPALAASRAVAGRPPLPRPRCRATRRAPTPRARLARSPGGAHSRYANKSSCRPTTNVVRDSSSPEDDHLGPSRFSSEQNTASVGCDEKSEMSRIFHLLSIANIFRRRWHGPTWRREASETESVRVYARATRDSPDRARPGGPAPRAESRPGCTPS